jgi:hypothetical protein
MKKTTTSAFGVGRRESHDASAFYNRNLYSDAAGALPVPPQLPVEQPASVPGPTAWRDRIYCGS